jgi:hypothetical protein
MRASSGLHSRELGFSGERRRRMEKNCSIHAINRFSFTIFVPIHQPDGVAQKVFHWRFAQNYIWM